MKHTVTTSDRVRKNTKLSIFLSEKLCGKVGLLCNYAWKKKRTEKRGGKGYMELQVG